MKQVLAIGVIVVFSALTGCATTDAKKAAPTAGDDLAPIPSHCSFFSKDDEFKAVFLSVSVSRTRQFVPFYKGAQALDFGWDLKLNFDIQDCTGVNSFRIADTGEVFEFRTPQGEDLSEDCEVQLGGDVLDAQFPIPLRFRERDPWAKRRAGVGGVGHISCHPPQMPDRIDRVRGYFEVDVLRELQSETVSAEKLADWFDIRPGLRVRLCKDDEVLKRWGKVIEYETTSEEVRVIEVDAKRIDGTKFTSLWDRRRYRVGQKTKGGFLPAGDSSPGNWDKVASYQFFLSEKVERVRINYDIRNLWINADPKTPMRPVHRQYYP